MSNSFFFVADQISSARQMNGQKNKFPGGGLLDCLILLDRSGLITALNHHEKDLYSRS